MRYAIIVMCLFFFGCTQIQTVDQNENRIKTVMASIAYAKDPKTGLCFGYAWEGAVNHGGPAFVHVPCEAVAAYLITNK